MVKRQATITRILEDGSEEVTYIDLESKPSSKKKPVRKSKKNPEEVSQDVQDNSEQEEKQVTCGNKASIGIKPTES